MWSFFVAALNGCIRNEPGVATTAAIASASVRPARDVRLVLIRDAKREPIELNPSGLCEMKNVFVAIIQKTLRVDGLEMSAGNDFTVLLLDADLFDPVNGIL